MARIDADGVRTIINTDITDPQIDIYLKYAETISADYLEDSGLSEEALTEIERWITAHLIAATHDPAVISQKAGPVEQKFADIYTKGFGSTSYGQVAISLDSSGTLAELSDSKKSIVIKAVDE